MRPNVVARPTKIAVQKAKQVDADHSPRLARRLRRRAASRGHRSPSRGSPSGPECQNGDNDRRDAREIIPAGPIADFPPFRCLCHFPSPSPSKRNWRTAPANQCRQLRRASGRFRRAGAAASGACAPTCRGSQSPRPSSPKLSAQARRLRRPAMLPSAPRSCRRPLYLRIPRP